MQTRKRVPRSWAFPLGALKAAGALGLLAGLVVPPLGTAAAICLVLFFVGAVVAHVRARYRRVANVTVFLVLVLAVAALSADLLRHTRG